MGIKRNNGKTDFEGMVYRIQSEFKMDLHRDIVTYYDVKERKFETETLAQCNDYAEVDATEDIKKLWSLIEDTRNLKLEIAQNENEKYHLVKGAKVKVFKGRNIKKDTICFISAIYENDKYKTIYLIDSDGNKLGKTYEDNLLIEVSGEFVEWKHNFDLTQNCRITCGGHY